jgi:nucleoside-diphosphate-sugar epimerase
MRVFLTGGTGFIGSRVAARLRDRGDEVRALARDAERGAALAEAGCELVLGTVSDEEVIREGMRGRDAVIHGAGIYEVGIRRGDREPMYEANVLGTERVLRSALGEEIPRVVYVSTVAAFGNTNGRVVDESYTHPGEQFTSYYEKTKWEAHQIARRMIDEEGLPCVIVQPGGVYGPGDHSQLGNTIDQFVSGRLPLVPFPDLGINLVHVDDVAEGILLALDKGKIGEQYVLGGTITTMREILEGAAHVTGRRAPKRAMPTAMLKATAPIGGLVGPLLGYPPNIGELISSADGVTFWAKHDKAIAELGYSPRGLEAVLRDTLEAEGKLPAPA